MVSTGPGCIVPAITGTTPGSCAFTVTWTLTSAVNRNYGERAQLRTVYDNAVTPAARVSMMVCGRIPRGPVLTAPPSAPTDFGKPSVNVDSTTLTVTVTNTGESAAGDLTVARTDNTASNQLTTTGTCDGTALAAGTNCTVVVTGKPQAAGASSGSPAITVGDGTIAQLSLGASWTATNPARLVASVTTLDLAKSRR